MINQFLQEVQQSNVSNFNFLCKFIVQLTLRREALQQGKNTKSPKKSSRAYSESRNNY